MKSDKLIQESYMKKFVFGHLMTFCFYAAFLTFVFAINAAAQSGGSGNVKTTIANVRSFSGTAVIPQAGASLSSNNEGVFATISTSSLTPGHVVTLWWAIFNNPENCATTSCVPSDLNNPAVNGSAQFGGGYIVGLNGRANFSGYLAAGDNTGFEILPPFPNMPNPSPGLVDPKGAEIHLIIRTHGPASADPAVLQQQLTKFGGGCSAANPCANIQAAQFIQNIRGGQSVRQ